jgi:hypothetical protein
MIPLPAVIGREARFLPWIYYQDAPGSILIGVSVDETGGSCVEIVFLQEEASAKKTARG